MKLSNILLWVWGLIFVSFLAALMSQDSCEVEQRSQQVEKRLGIDSLVVSSARSVPPKTLASFDSIMVIHLHPTVQCSCCINVGSFARKGLEQFYTKSYNDSLIIFKEYDIDEDSSTAKRYGIFWSALGFEKFCGEEKEFKEIESVWEFCEDEEKFLLNFKREIDEFIMRSKKVKSEDQNRKQNTVKPTDKKPENRYPQKSDGNGGNN